VPFTVSHVALVLPLARTPLPFAALALGSMSPDLPYFLPVNVTRDFTHSLAGAVTVDLALALVLWAAWVVVMRAPIVDYAPRWVADRMTRHGGIPQRPVAASVVIMVAAVEIGIATHFAWDSVTHGGWITELFPVLSTVVGGYPLVLWLHIGSSVLGGVILALWVRAWARRTSPVAHPTGIVASAERRWALGIFVVLLVAVAFAIWIAGIVSGRHPADESLLFDALVLPISIMVAAAFVASLVWHGRMRAAARSRIER